MVITTQGFLEVFMEIKLEWDINQRQINYFQII